MCDLAHALLSERVERVALADRAALLTAAAVNGAKEYEPVDVDARLAEFDAWLCAEPSVSVDDVRARQLMEEVA